MSPVRRHFWQLVARVNSSLTLPRKWSLNWFMPAGVNRTLGSQRGTSTSLGLRVWPLDSKKARYFSRISLVFMARYRGNLTLSRLNLIYVGPSGPTGVRERPSYGFQFD